ncbi:MAG: hypothetical protein PVS2B2_23110 [Candidatus Acidiferrum sp.]
MRKRKTHFEQIPIKVAESVLRRAMELARRLENSPESVSALERQAVLELLKQEENTPCKG